MVKNFLKDCGNEFLQELLIPSRLDKAMKALDTDGSGVIEIEEWSCMLRLIRRLRLATAVLLVDLHAIDAASPPDLAASSTYRRATVSTRAHWS